MNVFALRHPPVKSTAHYHGRTLKRSLLNRIRTKTKNVVVAVAAVVAVVVVAKT